MICRKCQLWTAEEKMRGEYCWACAPEDQAPQVKYDYWGRGYRPILKEERFAFVFRNEVEFKMVLRGILGDPPPRICGLASCWWYDESRDGKRSYIPMFDPRAPWLVAVGVRDVQVVPDAPNHYTAWVGFAAATEPISKSSLGKDWSWS